VKVCLCGKEKRSAAGVEQYSGRVGSDGLLDETDVIVEGSSPHHSIIDSCSYDQVIQNCPAIVKMSVRPVRKDRIDAFFD
jgi:hypothetical protein